MDASTNGRRTRREFLQWTCMVSEAVALAACAQKPPQVSKGAEPPEVVATEPEPEATTVAKTPVTIQYGVWGGDATVKAEQPVVDLFHDSQPDVRVEVQMAPGVQELYQKVLTQLAGGASPDVFWMGEVWVWSFASKGALTDLGPFIQRDGVDESIWYEAAYEDLKYDGKPYAIPSYVGPYMMYYNKDLYDEVGLDYPIESPDDSWTLETFLKNAEQLTARNADRSVVTYGTAPWTHWLDYIPTIWSFGGDVINQDRTKSLLDQPEAIAALQTIVDMMHKEPKIAPTPSDISGAGKTVFDMLINNQVAHYGAGRWGAWSLHDPEKNEPRINWGVAPRPTHKQFATPVLFVAWGIPQASQNHDAAWQWVKFVMANKDVQVLYNSSGLGIPIMKEAADSREYLFNYEPATNHDIYVASLSKGRGLPYHAAWAKTIDEVVMQEFDLMWIAEKTAEEAAEAAAMRMNEELAEQS